MNHILGGRKILLIGIQEDNKGELCMNWDKLYEEWGKEKIDGIIMFDKGNISKFNKINEYNRELYVEYHNYFLNKSGRKKTSYKAYRSKIVDFLKSSHICNKKLSSLTQSDVERYFEERKIQSNEKPTTYNSRVQYIKDFIKFHENKMDCIISLDHLPMNKLSIDEEKEYMPIAMSSEEIEEYRHVYFNQPTKLFLFEMIYYTGINLKEFRMLNYSIYDKNKEAFIINDKKSVIVPKKLIKLVERLKDEKFFNGNKDYNELIDEIKRELREQGITENFKCSDIKKTVDSTSFIKCPECKERYEAIVDNWVSKQYYSDGDKWIVCKKCGGLDE